MSDDNWFDVKKKPVTVQARGPYYDPHVVETLEGNFAIDEKYIEEHDGFYILRGVNGEVYPCGADIFNDTYEKVNND